MPAFFCKVYGKQLKAANLGELVKAVAGHLVVEEDVCTIDIFRAGFTLPSDPATGFKGSGTPNQLACSVKRYPGGKVSLTYPPGFDKDSRWPVNAIPLSDNEG